MLKLELEKTGLNEKLYKNSKIQKKLKLAYESLHSMDKSCGTGWVETPSLTSKNSRTSKSFYCYWGRWCNQWN